MIILLLFKKNYLKFHERLYNNMDFMDTISNELLNMV
jgi:hypothetical protein